MLIASLGVIAALTFVLGLGAVCLWALKRWGMGSLSATVRLPVEVVQRVPLGPKTGLTVVRVGEKVVALAVGEGGVTTLFELDERDRQQVVASSAVPVPHRSSAQAAAAYRPLVPASLAGPFGRLLGQQLRSEAGPAHEVARPGTAAPVAAAPVAAASFAPLSLTERAEIPRFLTAPLTTSRGTPLTYPTPIRPTSAARGFGPMLDLALGGTARLAAMLAVFTMTSASTLVAQTPATQPPVVQPPVVPPTPASAPSTTIRPATPATAPLVIDVPKLDLAPLVPITIGQPPAAPPRPAPRLTPSRAVGPATQPPVPRPGNGAAVTAQGTAPRQPMNRVVVDSATDVPPKAQSASPAPIAADEAIMRMMPQMDVQVGGDAENGGLRLNGTVGIVIMMGLLTLLPTLLLMMTGFTRILIVLQFLKQAMGTQSAPPGQLLAAMALLLTGFVMGPTLAEMHRTAITPWLDGKMTQVEMMTEGVKPMRAFMLRQTRESDVKTFVELSRLPRPATVDDVPLHVLMSAFVASELRTAFQIGFAIYLPFIIIDTVVASVLMSMGMFMLPPAMISLPFKLLLFVLVDGWSLTITSLVQSFK